MKDPAFLFYAQDWITGTLTMTMEERGQYITILAVMHQTGRLDEKTISFLVGNVSDNLKNKFSIDSDGKWFNKRLEEEIEKRAKFAESRRKNGSKGGRPKASAKPSGYPSDKPINNHTENEDEDVNDNEKGVVKLKDRIPTLENFIAYGLEQAAKNRINVSETALSMKYEAWKENGWINGNGQPIKSWKSSLINTLQYIKNNEPPKEKFIPNLI